MSVDEDKITVHAVVNAARSYEAARRLREHYYAGIQEIVREKGAGTLGEDPVYTKYKNACDGEAGARKLFLSVAHPYLGNCRQGELTACVFGEPFRIDDVIYMIEEHGKKLIRVDLKTTPTLTPKAAIPPGAVVLPSRVAEADEPGRIEPDALKYDHVKIETE